MKNSDIFCLEVLFAYRLQSGFIERAEYLPSTLDKDIKT